MTLLFVALAGCAGAATAPLFDPVIDAAAGRVDLRTRRRPGPRSCRRLALAGSLGAVESLVAFRFGPSLLLAPYAVFCSGLVLLAFCDAQFLVLPKRIWRPVTLSTAVFLVLATCATGQWHRLAIAGACGAGAFALFFAVNAVGPGGLAFGDVRLAGSIGGAAGFLGPGRVEVAFVSASLLAALVAVALLVTRRARWGTKLPYGVFLALGAALAIIG